MKDLLDLTVEIAGLNLKKKPPTTVDTVIMLVAVLDPEVADDYGIPLPLEENADPRTHPTGKQVNFDPPELGATILLSDVESRDELLRTGFSVSGMNVKGNADGVTLTIKGRISPAKRGIASALMDKDSLACDLTWATAPVRLDELDELLEVFRDPDNPETWNHGLMSAVVNRIGRDLFADEFFSSDPDSLPEGWELDGDGSDTPFDEREIILTDPDGCVTTGTAQQFRAVLDEIKAMISIEPTAGEGNPLADETPDDDPDAELDDILGDGDGSGDGSAE
mgnify:CR=1 FL=1